MIDRIEDVNAPKTLEFWIPDEVVLASLGFVSGLLSIASGFFVDWAVGAPRLGDVGFYLAPGIWFAIAVMLPFRSLVTYWCPRLLLAIAVCSCANALACDLVRASMRGNSGLEAWEWLLRMMTIGAMGALISGKGVLVLLGRPWRYRILALMIAAGAFGMFSIYLWFFIHPIWQAAVAAPLGGLRRELQAEQTRQDPTR